MVPAPTAYRTDALRWRRPPSRSGCRPPVRGCPDLGNVREFRRQLPTKRAGTGAPPAPERAIQGTRLAVSEPGGDGFDGQATVAEELLGLAPAQEVEHFREARALGVETPLQGAR